MAWPHAILFLLFLHLRAVLSLNAGKPRAFETSLPATC